MPKKAKMGRPPLPKKDRLGQVYGARFVPAEEADVLRAIKASGKSKADWIREALLSVARAK